ncbi:hypothetical protein EYZ11_005723 [Aspergillus tanneri]|uniref:Uncharacterized protein n=1 Tax=Aspergillus tanneri TaxID=1220188 RepID=A0A4S3JJJ1_9EURO|nr:hypothetical protein EYZ11_005723 [Aspergillus tanneri]
MHHAIAAEGVPAPSPQKYLRTTWTVDPSMRV